MTIAEIEQQLTTALKNRDVVTSRTLRLLLARLKNERITIGHDLTDVEVEHIVQSEYKKRKEAAAEFEKAGRAELLEGELAEAKVLLAFLPAQASETDIRAAIDELVLANSFTAKEFGVAMKALKDKFGATADGAELSRLLKEKLS
jgi:uncharacterized protein YqeY